VSGGPLLASSVSVKEEEEEGLSWPRYPLTSRRRRRGGDLSRLRCELNLKGEGRRALSRPRFSLTSRRRRRREGGPL